MKTEVSQKKWILIDNEFDYLHFDPSCGGYFSHSPRLNVPTLMRFESQLCAMIFASGYNSISGLPEKCHVYPVYLNE